MDSESAPTMAGLFDSRGGPIVRRPRDAQGWLHRESTSRNLAVLIQDGDRPPTPEEDGPDEQQGETGCELAVEGSGVAAKMRPISDK